MENIDYQRGFLTGYSGGFYFELSSAFNQLFMYYPTHSIWQIALATEFSNNKN